MNYIKLALPAICIAMCAIAANAQNIVPNSNFTIHSACPGAPGQVIRCTGWYQVTQGTADYYDSCATDASMDVPNNIFGTQSNNANAYAGIYAYNISGIREYFGIDIPALTVGATYKVSIRVSLAENSHYGIDGLGVYFYCDAKPDTSLWTYIPYMPQADYTSYGTVTSQTTWTMLSKNFVADSGYTHLVVGSFRPDSMLTKTPVTGGTGPARAYYYIDSVAVENLTALTTPVPCINTTRFYPNPVSADAILTFDNPLHQPHTLLIFDAQGRVVNKKEGIVTGSVTMQRNDLSKGFYYYRLFDGIQMVGNGKMFVE